MDGWHELVEQIQGTKIETLHFREVNLLEQFGWDTTKLMLYGPVGLRLKWCSMYSYCCLSHNGKWICLRASDSQTTVSIPSSPQDLCGIDSAFARMLTWDRLRLRMPFRVTLGGPCQYGKGFVINRLQPSSSRSADQSCDWSMSSSATSDWFMQLIEFGDVICAGVLHHCLKSFRAQLPNWESYRKRWWTFLRILTKMGLQKENGLYPLGCHCMFSNGTERRCLRFHSGIVVCSLVSLLFQSRCMYASGVMYCQEIPVCHWKPGCFGNSG